MTRQVNVNSETAINIVEYIKANGGKSAEEIAMQFGIGRNHAKKVASKCKTVGLLVKVKCGKTNEVKYYSQSEGQEIIQAKRAVYMEKKRVRMENYYHWKKNNPAGAVSRGSAAQKSVYEDEPDWHVEQRIISATRTPPPMTTAPASVFAWRP